MDNRTNDLVAKLRLVRKRAKYEYAKDEFLMIGLVMREAADEIERLRKALSIATQWFSSVEDTYTTQQAIDNMRNAARTALRESQP